MTAILSAVGLHNCIADFVRFYLLLSDLSLLIYGKQIALHYLTGIAACCCIPLVLYLHKLYC